jgi:cation diffusion facilitator family transporter
MESGLAMMREKHTAAKSRAAAWSVATCSLLVVLKLGVGFATGSIGILSEAAHSAVDLIAAAMAYFAVRSAGKPADKAHPFGHGKFESLSGAVEALLIFLAAGGIIAAAIHRLLEGGRVELLAAGAVVMGASALANWLVSLNLFRVGRATDSIALEADAWHLRTDVYTSLGVGVGMVVMLVSRSLWWIDPAVALGIALLILKAATDLTRGSVAQILDRALPPEEEKLVVDLLEQHYSGYIEFHRLRTRKSGSERHLDLHLVVPSEMTVKAAHDLCDHLEADIRKLLPGARALIHVEPGPAGQTGQTGPTSPTSPTSQTSPTTPAGPTEVE